MINERGLKRFGILHGAATVTNASREESVVTAEGTSTGLRTRTSLSWFIEAMLVTKFIHLLPSTLLSGYYIATTVFVVDQNNLKTMGWPNQETLKKMSVPSCLLLSGSQETLNFTEQRPVVVGLGHKLSTREARIAASDTSQHDNRRLVGLCHNG